MKSHPPEEFRLILRDCQRLGFTPALASTAEYGMNGMFFVRCGREILRCMISDGACVEDETGQWEHVSVSLRTRCPTWEEMCFVKSLFWDDEEVVIQYHPRKSEYVNNHPFVLHLWRPKSATIPAPPPILVGIKGVELRPK